MALSHRERIELLRQAVRLQCRSFVEYMGESAPPYDLASFPAFAEAMAEIVADKHDLADRLVEVTLSLDSHADLTVAFNPRFTYYNYLRSDFAIKVLLEHIERELAAAEELLAEGAGDPVVGPLLTEQVDRERRYLDRIRALIPTIRSTTTEPPVAA